MKSTTKLIAVLASFGLLLAGCDRGSDPVGLTGPPDGAVAPNLVSDLGNQGLGESAEVPPAVLSVASASPGNILIYGPSMSGPPNEQTLAVAAGHTVTVVNAAAWSGMTTAQFGSYDAIVFGDPTCVSNPGPVAAADANKAVWSAAINGPMYVQGTDPIFHVKFSPTAPASQMITSGINFAASRPGTTGLYASLSCYFFNAPRNTAVSFLSAIGSFQTGPQEGCPSVVNIVDPAHPAMAGLTNAGLSNWGCSPHDFLLAFPSNFNVLATGVRPSDGAVLPFIVATPAIIIVEIDIKPGSDPNSINPKSKGVVPVAILGSAEFDVSDIDRATLMFGPGGATPAHRALGHLENVNGDAYMDLVSHYPQQETGLSASDAEACVTGETLGGLLFEGCDAVRVLNK